MSGAGSYRPYFMASGMENFTGLWEARLADPDRRVMFVLGMGFDPRTTDCIKLISKARTNSSLHCRTIDYDDRDLGDAGLAAMADRNREEFGRLMEGLEWDKATVRMDPDVDHATAADAFKNCIRGNDLKNYTDFVVDISAMPPDVYFPILKRLLAGPGRGAMRPGGEAGGTQRRLGVHVVASENAELDSRIKEAGLAEKASYLHGFSGSLQLESEKHLPKVWMPVLGEGKRIQMDRICDDVDPSEVAPLFPFPSADPYRSGRMLLEYREILLDKLGIDPANFVYSHEQNPFELQRKICATALRYSKSLGLLDRCHIVLSPMSSKMRGLGCLLAALDLGGYGQSVGVAYVKNHAYRMDAGGDLGKILRETVPISASLAGGGHAA